MWQFIVSFCYKLWSCIKIYLIGVQCLASQIIYSVKIPTDVNDVFEPAKVAIVTGGAKGIGYHISRQLVKAGVHVIMGVREMDLATETLAKIRKDFPSAKVEAIELDLSSFASIRKFSTTFLAKSLPLNILINNAGVMFVPYRLTDDGWEEHLQVNYLGHYLLTHLLLDCLKQSGTRENYSRIISVSSHVHYAGDFHLEKTANRDTYSCHAAYAQSKLAIVMFMHTLHRLLAESSSRVTINCVHPGVVNTDLFRHVNKLVKLGSVPLKIIYKTPDQGAMTSVYLALSPRVATLSGGYYDNCDVIKPADISFNVNQQDRLWSISQEAVIVSQGDR